MRKVSKVHERFDSVGCFVWMARFHERHDEQFLLLPQEKLYSSI